MNVITVCPPQWCHSPSTSRCHSHSTSSAAAAALSYNRSFPPAPSLSSSCSPSRIFRAERESSSSSSSSRAVVSAGLGDFIGGDLLGFDLDKWSKDVEDYGSIAVYPPHEGGYEGRYAARLRTEGYYFMNISARGLGDPEAYLTKIHGVRPAHVGKQKIECFYFPPEVDYRLNALPPNAKGLVLWVIEAKVLSKTELQYLALLPALRPRVKVIAEVGNWRSYRWKPLREAAGLPLAAENNEAVIEKQPKEEEVKEESKGSEAAVAEEAPKEAEETPKEVPKEVERV